MSDWSSSFDLLTRTTGAASTTGTTPSKVDDTYYTNENYTGEPREKVKDNSTLTFEDMLLLMVTQLQNQTIDNQADTNDMMNQLIQMTVMQAMTEMSTQVEELTQANVMSYAASLVGKEVTVGVYNEETKKIDEIVGTVTATGIYDGMNVIFIGDKSYTSWPWAACPASRTPRTLTAPRIPTTWKSPAIRRIPTAWRAAAEPRTPETRTSPLRAQAEIRRTRTTQAILPQTAARKLLERASAPRKESDIRVPGRAGKRMAV